MRGPRRCLLRGGEWSHRPLPIPFPPNHTLPHHTRKHWGLGHFENTVLCPTQVSVSLSVKGHAAAAAKSLQSCPTLCDPIDSSPPGSPVPGILQPRTLEWVAISFCNAWKSKVKGKTLSHVRLFATPRTAAYQGSSVHGICQARILEWGTIAFSIPLATPTNLRFLSPSSGLLDSKYKWDLTVCFFICVTYFT